MSVQLTDQIAGALRRFHNSSCYPSAEPFEVEAATNTVLRLVYEDVARMLDGGAEAARDCLDHMAENGERDPIERESHAAAGAAMKSAAEAIRVRIAKT